MLFSEDRSIFSSNFIISVRISMLKRWRCNTLCCGRDSNSRQLISTKTWDLLKNALPAEPPRRGKIDVFVEKASILGFSDFSNEAKRRDDREEAMSDAQIVQMNLSCSEGSSDSLVGSFVRLSF